MNLNNPRCKVGRPGANPKKSKPEITLEPPSEVFLKKMSDIVIPEELSQPMKIPLKFILNQFHRGTCDPVVLTNDYVLVDGIAQIKVAKLLKWTKIPAVHQNNECSQSPGGLK